jgi:hypothetical protein
MEIERTFVWKDGRPDDHDTLQSAKIEHLVLHGSARFELRSWRIRYSSGKRSVAEATYDERR